MSEETSMRIGSGSLGRVLVMRLGPGADLYKSLQELARRENIKAGVILSGAASLRQAVLRNVKSVPKEFPITDANRLYVAKEEPMELLALSGNFSQRDGEIHVHAHVTISTGAEDGRAYGGHLVEGNIVMSLAEIVVAEIVGLPMVRHIDPETKAPELYFE